MTRRPIKSVPKRDRPREKLLAKGAGALSDRELAAVLMGSGTKGRDVLSVADEIVRALAELQRAGGSPTEELGGGAMRPGDLLGALHEINGIGPAKAAVVAAGFELSRRYFDNSRVRIRRSEDVLPLVAFIASRKQEHLVCVSLNGAHEVIATRVVAVGALTESLVHPREVFADPIVDRAAAVILVHNHPSGNLEPSEADKKTSRRFAEAGKLLGIEVLDHIIISSDGHRSVVG